MSIVNVLNVTVLNNPSHFLNPFQFQIQFECLQDLPEDIEWKLTYVGNAENPNDDQLLEELCVGPIAQGIHSFVFQAPAPQYDKIANEDLIGVTVILLSCNYLEQKFIQIGYYVNNDYAVPFEPENYPNPVDINLLTRNILADEPRVTRYAIDWTGQSPVTNTDDYRNTDTTADGGVNTSTAVKIEGEADEDEVDIEIDDEDEEDEDEEEDDDSNEEDIDIENEEEDDEEEEEGQEDEGEDNEGEDALMEKDDNSEQNDNDDNCSNNNNNNNNQENIPINHNLMTTATSSSIHHYQNTNTNNHHTNTFKMPTFLGGNSNNNNNSLAPPQIFINEDSMDVHSMQIEQHSTHSHSHSFPATSHTATGVTTAALYY